MILAVAIVTVPVPVPAIAVSAVAVAVVFTIAVLELELLAVASWGFPRTRLFLGCLSFEPGGLPRLLPVRYMLGGGMGYSVAGA